MKKLGFIVIPLMVVSLLASCNNSGGGGDKEKVEFMLSSEQQTTVESNSATVYVDWEPTDHKIEFESFTFTTNPVKKNTVTFDQAGDPRPMPVKITFNDDEITEDINGTLSFTYEDKTTGVRGTGSIVVTITAPKPEPLCVTCLSDSANLKISCLNEHGTLPNLEYSRDQIEWNIVNIPETIDLKKGDEIYFRGDNPNGFNDFSNKKEDVVRFYETNPNHKLSIRGHIMSLLFKEDYKKEQIPTCRSNLNGCFANLFSENKALVDAANLILPAGLSKCCYKFLFSSCTSLTTAPQLNATIFPEGSYSNMFQSCSSLYIQENESNATVFFKCPSDCSTAPMGMMFFGAGGTHGETPSPGYTYSYI